MGQNTHSYVLCLMLLFMGEELIQFLATLAILPRTILKNRT